MLLDTTRLSITGRYVQECKWIYTSISAGLVRAKGFISTASINA
ncbi:hypothetical protein LD85_2806 [Saccharolobus islandicus L.D.8.5]|uniref:Uncharacterized protein n=1 Tax=Saccharolobus islandicus (strain L.D.8.5 / Lassen \|nr:hypothetical protein LD85_2806 [Sulfolobus islandicus L.D.8.5]